MKIRITKANDPLAEAFAASIASVESQVEIQKLTIVEELLRFMAREGISRSELATRMGVPPSRITKMLSGDNNLTIDTLVRAGRAAGADLVQSFVPQGQKGQWVGFEPKAANDGCIRVHFRPETTRRAPSPGIPSQETAKEDAERAA
jgi:transcriptional regulator with XRE-family HTH domain